MGTIRFCAKFILLIAFYQSQTRLPNVLMEWRASLTSFSNLCFWHCHADRHKSFWVVFLYLSDNWKLHIPHHWSHHNRIVHCRQKSERYIFRPTDTVSIKKQFPIMKIKMREMQEIRDLSKLLFHCILDEVWPPVFVISSWLNIGTQCEYIHWQRVVSKAKCWFLFSTSQFLLRKTAFQNNNQHKASG